MKIRNVQNTIVTILVIVFVIIFFWLVKIR